MSRYTKTIAGVGVAAQKYNPEMKSPETDDMVVMALDEKLQKMGRVSTSHRCVNSDMEIIPEIGNSNLLSFDLVVDFAY